MGKERKRTFLRRCCVRFPKAAALSTQHWCVREPFGPSRPFTESNTPRYFISSATRIQLRGIHGHVLTNALPKTTEDASGVNAPVTASFVQKEPPTRFMVVFSQLHSSPDGPWKDLRVLSHTEAQGSEEKGTFRSSAKHTYRMMMRICNPISIPPPPSRTRCEATLMTGSRQRIKSTALRAEPCGKPLSTENGLDRLSLVITLARSCVANAISNLTALGPRPMACKTLRRYECFTESKADLKSTDRKPLVLSGSSAACLSNSDRRIDAWSILRPERYAN